MLASLELKYAVFQSDLKIIISILILIFTRIRLAHSTHLQSKSALTYTYENVV